VQHAQAEKLQASARYEQHLHTIDQKNKAYRHKIAGKQQELKESFFREEVGSMRCRAHTHACCPTGRARARALLALRLLLAATASLLKGRWFSRVHLAACDFLAQLTHSAILLLDKEVSAASEAEKAAGEELAGYMELPPSQDAARIVVQQAQAVLEQRRAEYEAQVLY
jgi:hypothetical protein